MPQFRLLILAILSFLCVTQEWMLPSLPLTLAASPPVNDTTPSITTYDQDARSTLAASPAPEIEETGLIDGLLKGAIVDQLMKALGNVIQNDAPLLSSAKDIFPIVDQLPGTPFNPSRRISPIVYQLRLSNDGAIKLKPGDYSLPVKLICMKQKASSPRGHRYLLAPLKGNRADVIAALNAKAAGLNIPYAQLQALSWKIQAGMPYEELDRQQQSLVNRLIPDLRQKLSRSFLQQIEATYNRIAIVANLPPLDAMLDQLGDVGKIIRSYKEFRNTLLQYQSNYEAMIQALIPPAEASTSGGAINTPWSRISDRVFARLITEESAGGIGQWQLRVLPPHQSIAVKSETKSTDQSLATVNLTTIVADSQKSSVQPLTAVPEPPAVSERPPCDESDGGAELESRSLSNFANAIRLLDRQTPANGELPSFAAMWNLYPQGSAEEVRARIGGTIDNPNFKNTCAIRMSNVLNNVSEKTRISKSDGETRVDAQGRPHLLRVNDVERFLTRHFGKPDVAWKTQNGSKFDPTKIQGQQGIMIIRAPFSPASAASGHTTLWNGTTCAQGNDCYFDSATSIHLWTVPE